MVSLLEALPVASHLIQTNRVCSDEAYKPSTVSFSTIFQAPFSTLFSLPLPARLGSFLLFTHPKYALHLGLCTAWNTLSTTCLHSLLLCFFKYLFKGYLIRDFPGGPLAKTPYSQCRGLGSIPAQGTRPHMPQLRVAHAATEIKHSTMANKTWCSQINK